jgi:uncharacterized protein
MTQYDFDYAKPKNESIIAVQGLMKQVYIWMTGGLAITALVAFLTISTSLIFVVAEPLVFYGALFGEIALVWWLSANLHKIQTGTAIALFFVYAALNGFTISLILFIYGIGTVVPAFMTTAGLFGVMSILAITTDIDLSKYGTYLLMGVVGLIIAMIVNMFVNNGSLDWLISVAGVIIFTALTAYDTQRIYRMAQAAPEGSDMSKLAIMGALKLYLDFINLFLFLLRLFGRRR